MFTLQVSRYCLLALQSSIVSGVYVILFKKLKLPYHIQYDLVLQIQVGENLNLIAQTSSG